MSQKGQKKKLMINLKIQQNRLYVKGPKANHCFQEKSLCTFTRLTFTKFLMNPGIFSCLFHW